MLPSQDLNPQPVNRKSVALPIAPPRHLDPEATPKYFSRSLVGNLARFSRLASFFKIVCIGLPNGPAMALLSCSALVSVLNSVQFISTDAFLRTNRRAISIFDVRPSVRLSVRLWACIVIIRSTLALI